MSLSQFNRIKACIIAAFTPNVETKARDGKTWCPIPEYTPTTDEWGPVQAIVNNSTKIDKGTSTHPTKRY